MKYSDDQIEQLIKNIFDGKITATNLPEDLYFAIADHLRQGVLKGFGEVSGFGDGPSKELLVALEENIYMFSGAKTFQQINDISLVKDSEDIKSFGEFKAEALNIFQEYNVDWLETEYHTAVAQAQNALRWDQIEQQKEVLPMLRYSAVMDANTSEICAPLDGITLPVDDPFWDEFMPTNHFNCRCTVEQLDDLDKEVKPTPDEEVSERTATASKDMQDIFKMNPGKDKIIFSPEHPYFDVAKKYDDFAADNFGLPIPDSE